MAVISIIRKKCLWFLLLLLTSIISNAQQSPDSLGFGNVRGAVKDSSHNFMLIGATVAIYRISDSSIIQFTLTNEFGEFRLSRLPILIPLKFVITYVGYKPFVKEFLHGISNNTTIQMDTIHLHNVAEFNATNEEVIITSIAPMRMRGDTLEFNADAFRLDSNATVEGLMRRLPGFTIWGDGEITFNGKKLQAIYVNGKPFFGNNIAVATQNLPKEIISKIQVYQQPNEHNPYDSTLYANIKLKEGKDVGLFGKISAGFGTDKRYSADAMLSKYNKKMQFSVIGVANNVNKIANNIQDLIKSSSFKGEGANIDYQPDFDISGLNRPIVAGVQWNYDFLPDVIYFRKHRVTSDYFLQHNTSNIISEGFIKTALGRDSLQTQNIKSTKQSIQTRHFLNANYEKVLNEYSFSLGIKSTLNENKQVIDDTTALETTWQGIVGTSRSLNEVDDIAKSIELSLKYQRFHEGDQKKKVPKNFTLEYNLKSQNSLEDAQINIINKSFLNLATSDFDRKYDKNEMNTNHTIRFVYPGLKQLILGNHVDLSGIGISLSQAINFQHSEHVDNVLDWKTQQRTYESNTNLTNKRNEHTISYEPTLSFYKNFNKGLTDRYYKYTNLNINIREQYYNHQSIAVKDIQNFKYDYWFFVPDVSMEYGNHQYGNRESKYIFNYQTKINYPTVFQIAPLIDSSNYWYLPMGNQNILPETSRELSFQYIFTTRKPKNPLNINVKIGLIIKKNAFSDSIVYNQEGRAFEYLINMQGQRAFKSDFSLKKSIEKRKNTFQIQLQNKFSMHRTPQFINSISNISRTLINEISVHFDYSYRDKLALKVQQGKAIYNSLQQGLDNTSFRSNNSFTRLIGTFQFPKNFLWNTNVTYNRSNFNYQSPINTTIWNASLSYRFMKGDKGEVKFSALDLLRQNRSIINTVIGNIQTFNSTNVLQQYFMLTFSYYPRNFGK